MLALGHEARFVLLHSLPKWRNHHFCLGKHQSAQHKTRSKLETKHHLTSRKDMKVLLLDAWCFLDFSVQVLLRRITLSRHQTQGHADCRFYCMLHIWEKRDELAQRDKRFVHVCACLCMLCFIKGDKHPGPCMPIWIETPTVTLSSSSGHGLLPWAMAEVQRF